MTVFQLSEGGQPAQPSPGWFVQWVRLGIQAATWCKDAAAIGTRRVLAVSAPTPAMASAALAFGFVRASYLQGEQDGALTASDRSALSTGDWIWFRIGHHVRTGRFLGFDDQGNIRTSNGHFMGGRIDEIRLLPDWMEKKDAKADCSDVVDAAFLQQILRARDPLAFATSWSTRLLIVGSIDRLRNELDVQLGPAIDDAVMGSLRQIVRPLDTHMPVGCQSVVVSSHAREAVWHAWPSPPALTLLRGAYATSRWLNEASGSYVIATLGRGEPGLDAATAALMQARSYSEPLASSQLGWAPPAGCEVLAYEEPA
ncbi:hypothetical protein ACI780_18080 [Geodermatophilus sp. SYSU D00814]